MAKSTTKSVAVHNQPLNCQTGIWTNIAQQRKIFNPNIAIWNLEILSVDGSWQTKVQRSPLQITVLSYQTPVGTYWPHQAGDASDKQTKEPQFHKYKHKYTNTNTQTQIQIHKYTPWQLLATSNASVNWLPLMGDETSRHLHIVDGLDEPRPTCPAGEAIGNLASCWPTTIWPHVSHTFTLFNWYYFISMQCTVLNTCFKEALPVRWQFSSWPSGGPQLTTTQAS